MNEKIFSSEITTSLGRDGVWNYKIPDIGYVLKPFDRVLDFNGKFVAIEEKQERTPAFNFKKIRPHQMANLLHVTHGFFLINFRFKNKKYGKVNTAFLIRAIDLKELIKGSLKSLKYSCIVIHPITVVSRINGKWNLAERLDEIMFGGE